MATKKAAPAAPAPVETTSTVTGDGSGTALPPADNSEKVDKIKPSEQEIVAHVTQYIEMMSDYDLVALVVTRLKARDLKENEVIALRHLKSAATLLLGS